MFQARAPFLGSLRQPVPVDPVQRQVVVQHVGALGQEILRRGDDEIEAVERRPGPADVHQAGVGPLVAWIQRATGSLRRPAVMTRSGQGGASSLEASRSIPARVAPSRRLVSSSQPR